jgi:putative membrane protein
MKGASAMNWESATSRIAWHGFACAFLWLASGIALANAQTAAPTEVPATLNAIDFNFVGQANLGAPFQVDSGHLAETKGTSAAIRSYAHLMVTSHIPVVDANRVRAQLEDAPSRASLHAIQQYHGQAGTNRAKPLR